MSEVGEVVVKVPKFQWELNVFCFYGKKVGDYVLSPTFSSSNYGRLRNDWKLMMYPKGYREENRGYLSLYLYNWGKDEIAASFSFSLLNRENVIVYKSQVVQNHLFESRGGTGHALFIEESFIMDPENSVLKDNKMTILCDIAIEDIRLIDKAEIESVKMVKRLQFFDDFEKLMTNKEFSDVTVTVGEQKFYLHKCILSAHSTVFEGMFRSDMKEKEENSVVIEDIRYEVLQEFFRFIYIGRVDKLDDLVGELLIAAEKYNVVELKTLCEETMCNSLTKSNAIGYLNSAIMNNVEKLETEAINFVYLHLEDFIEDSEFDEIGYQYPKLLLIIIKKLMNM